MKAMPQRNESGPQAGAEMTRAPSTSRRHDRMPLYQGFMRALFTALLAEVSERLRLDGRRPLESGAGQSL